MTTPDHDRVHCYFRYLLDSEGKLQNGVSRELKRRRERRHLEGGRTTQCCKWLSVNPKEIKKNSYLIRLNLPLQ